jgi:hypothetical protein
VLRGCRAGARRSRRGIGGVDRDAHRGDRYHRRVGRDQQRTGKGELARTEQSSDESVGLRRVDAEKARGLIRRDPAADANQGASDAEESAGGGHQRNAHHDRPLRLRLDLRSFSRRLSHAVRFCSARSDPGAPQALVGGEREVALTIVLANLLEFAGFLRRLPTRAHHRNLDAEPLCDVLTGEFGTQRAGRL